MSRWRGFPELAKVYEAVKTYRRSAEATGATGAQVPEEVKEAIAEVERVLGDFFIPATQTVGDFDIEFSSRLISVVQESRGDGSTVWVATELRRDDPLSSKSKVSARAARNNLISKRGRMLVRPDTNQGSQHNEVH